MKISVTKNGRTDSCVYLAAINKLTKHKLLFVKPNRTTLFLSQEAFERLKARYPKLNEPWQGADVEELKAMAADKVPLAAMSEQLGRTPNSLRIKLKSLGLYEPAASPRLWTEEDEKLLVEMYNQGVSFEDMAAHFGRSVRALVSRLVLLRMKLFPTDGEGQEEEMADSIELSDKEDAGRAD